MNERVVFALAIKVRSPFMFQGLVNARSGVDAAQLRDECDRPIIPSDQVRGVLRMALETLGGAPAWRDDRDEKKRAARPGRAPSAITKDEIIGLFGEGSKEVQQKGEEHDRPARGRLHFSDLVADREAEPGVTTRIEIDDAFGAVKAGALQVIELVATIGTDVTFSGDVVFDADAALPASKVEKVLVKALKLIPAIGAFKSAGFGEVVETTISVKQRSPVAAAKTAPWSGGATRRAYRLVFDRPILVDAKRVTDNLFVGSDVVPGAAIKGAIAERLRAGGVDPERTAPWAEALAALRVSHAFPENAAGVPFGFPVPNSVLCGGDSNAPEFGDALLHASRSNAGEGFVFGTRSKPTPARFPIDWKEKEFGAFAAGGTRFPTYEQLSESSRTHVAISPHSLAAIDQMLYGTIAKGVLRDPGPASRRAWRVVIDAERVATDCRDALFDIVNGGLGPIGRTGAFATFTAISSAAQNGFDALRLPARPPRAPVSKHEPDLYALTLLTPALMIDPRSDKDESEQYQAFWASACGGELVAAFTTRSLAGGYIATRRRLYGKTYYPFVLTETGSVFLLRNPDPARLDERLRYGLDPVALSGGKGGAVALNWRNCPYVPQNGYGEIACNLIEHDTLARGVTRV